MGPSTARLGVVLVLLVGLLGAVGGAAAAAPTAPVAPTVQAPTAAATGSGWNDWSCKPSARHPRPVVLVHALFVNAQINFATLGPKLRSAGYCVFSENYGTTSFGPVGGLAPMADSAASLGRFVDRVRTATGSAKVDMVGHSEGTTVPAYYMKFLGGDQKVGKFIGFAANYRGTSLYGLSLLADLLNVEPILRGGGCAACSELLAGSAFMRKLNNGPVAVPGPEYTSIVSRLDQVVVPYTSGELSGPNAKTVVLQDRCRTDIVGHMGQAVDPNVSNLVLHTLDPQNTPLRGCVPFVLPT